MNTVILTGRLTVAPEIKETSTGRKYSRFSIAVDDGYGDKKKTYFFGVTAWEKRAEFAVKYLRKGSKVILSGKLTAYEYEKDGEKHKGVDIVTNEIEFAETKKADSKQDQSDLPF